MPPGGRLSRRDAVKVLTGGAAAISSFRPGTPWAESRTEGERVKVTVGYSGSTGEQAARDSAHEIVYEFAFDALTIIVDPMDIDALRGLDSIRYVERDGVFVTTSQRLPWGIDRVDADVVHNAGETGNGGDIAIIDTGIDKTHGDLAPNLGNGTAFTGGHQHDQWQDDNGHGTHCAGIAAAVDNDIGVIGVAPKATLHAVKVMANPGAGLSSDVAKGIEWVADQGYDVGSMSLGGDQLEAVADACEYAFGKGVTLVAAAGNQGPCTDCVRYPAAYPEVIAVSATTQDDTLAEFSSQGPEVELAAPGDDIYSSSLGGYATRSGTSMACPHVSGAAGHLAAEGYSNEEIRQTLTESAEDIGLSRYESGAGLLDVPASLGQDGNGEKSASSSTETSTPTESPTPTPTATDSTSGGTAGDGGGGTGSSRSSPAPTRTTTATPTPTQMTTRPQPSTQSATATPTATRTGSPTQTNTARSSSTATPSPDEGITVGTGVRSWVRDTIGGLFDTVGEALRSILS